jgi:hypothetical protein
MAYIGVDKERYDAGNRFLSQDRYLANYNPRDAITFNVSPNMNTGIMGPGIFPYPIIPQEGGDGGGMIDPNRNSKFDYEFEALGDLYNKDNVPLTDEERETLNAQKNKDRLAMAAQLGLFALNPFGYAVRQITKPYTDPIFDKIQGKFTGGDGGGFDQDAYDAGKASAAAQEAANRDAARGGGDSGGGSTASTAGADTSRSDDSWSSSPFQYGGRVGYSNGYSVQDDMTDYAENVGKEASPGGGFEDSGSDGNNPPPPSYSTNEPPSNLNFNLVENIDPAFSYASRFGTLGGILNTTRTIQEEEPVGSLGYYDPSGNFGIGFDTDKGIVGAANLGNLNLGYTGVGGPTLNYMGGFANDAGRFGVNYNRDTGLNLGVSYNKKFNSGGIVGMYR